MTLTGEGWLRAYDVQGRLVDDGSRTYAWDLASRLSSRTKDANVQSFTYDALGNRLSPTGAGATRSPTTGSPRILRPSRSSERFPPGCATASEPRGSGASSGRIEREMLHHWETSQ